MDEDVMECDGERKALGASLLLHLILFLTAVAMDRAAVAAVWQFQFNPGDNGQRGVWTKTFRFQLN